MVNNVIWNATFHTHWVRVRVKVRVKFRVHLLLLTACAWNIVLLTVTLLCALHMKYSISNCITYCACHEKYDCAYEQFTAIQMWTNLNTKLKRHQSLQIWYSLTTKRSEERVESRRNKLLYYIVVPTTRLNMNTNSTTHK